MADLQTAQGTVVRTERGLSIAGTRITLYDIMGYLKAEWPPSLIQHWLNLTTAQMNAALDYIATHRDAVEDEYQTVLEHAAANRAYWEQRTRERRKYVASLPPTPGQEALYAKLRARKAELGME